jgi:hypothetical protein
MKKDSWGIYEARNFLSDKHNVPISCLEYIGFTDCSDLEVGFKLYQFNINQTGHVLHGGTVAYEFREMI